MANQNINHFPLECILTWGITLRELLSELPLPKSKPKKNSKSLLYDPHLAEAARKTLSTENEVLVSELVQRLMQTSLEGIEENVSDVQVGPKGSMPVLLQAVLERNRNIFGDFPGAQNALESQEKSRHSVGGLTDTICNSEVGQEVTQLKRPQKRKFSQISKGRDPQKIAACEEAQSAKSSSKQAQTTLTYDEESGLTRKRNKEQDHSHKSEIESIDCLSVWNNKNQRLVPVLITEVETKNERRIVRSQDEERRHNTKANEKKSGATFCVPLDKRAEKVSVKYSVIKLTRMENDITVAINKKKHHEIKADTDENKKESFNKSFSETTEYKKKELKEESGPIVKAELQPVKNKLVPVPETEIGKVKKRNTNENRTKPSSKLRISKNNSGRNVKIEPKSIVKRRNGLALVTKRKQSQSNHKTNDKRKTDRYRKEKYSFCEVRNLEMERKKGEVNVPTGTEKVHNFYNLLEHVSEAFENDMVEDDCLINFDIMQQLRNEVARAQDLGAMHMVPLDKLLALLKILDLNIQNGVDPSLPEMTTKRVRRASQACLVCLHIMTSPYMPKRIYSEEIVEHIVLFLNYQIQCNKGSKSVGRDLSTNISELLNLLTILVNIQKLNDSLILQMSGMVVRSVFNDELHSVSLNLLTRIFARYADSRSFVIDKILTTISSLQTKCQKNDLTALALELTQCTAAITESLPDVKKLRNVMIGVKCDNIVLVTQMFLTAIVKKCQNKREHINYTLMFDGFTRDLLSMVYNPLWPAAEVFLSVLARILMHTISNIDADIEYRISSLERLGIITAALRHDNIFSNCNLDDRIDIIIKTIRNKGTEENLPSLKANEKQILLQRVLLDFLPATNEDSKYARHFYIIQWYKEAAIMSPNNRASRRKRDNNDDIKQKEDFLVQKLWCDSTSDLNGCIDFASATLIALYLGSLRGFCQNFDLYLNAILSALKDPLIAIRTMAMRCITLITADDFSILNRCDIQMGVNVSFLDPAVAVREAAINLIGRFLVSNPELLDKYYEMLASRILDSSVSVRKRVISIFRDVCSECPRFSKVPEICVKLIQHVNDEESVQKLILDVFENMWFKTTNNEDNKTVLLKVLSITETISSCQDSSLESFERLLVKLITEKESKRQGPPKTVLTACQQIVDCLVDNIVCFDKTKEGTSSLSPYFITLYLFAKIRPQFVLKHVKMLPPFMELKCQCQDDSRIVNNTVRILELVVPFIHTDGLSLTKLERKAMALILTQDRIIINSCVSFLVVLTKQTQNYALIQHCLKRSSGYIRKFKSWMQTTETKNVENILYRQHLHRAIFLVGLLFRYFDMTDMEVIGNISGNIKTEVLESLMHLLHCGDFDVQGSALQAVRSITIRYPDLMRDIQLKDLYHKLLTSGDVPASIKTRVLMNVESYLVEEDKRMCQSSYNFKSDSLKVLGDERSGIASTEIQFYLKEVLQCYLHCEFSMRQAAFRIVQIVLEQGLVHPGQIVPYLISMSTDPEPKIAHSADNKLGEIEKRYPNFIRTKTLQGLKLSFQLQKIIQSDVVRGLVYSVSGECTTPLNGYLYCLVRNSKRDRRAVVLDILRQFDEHVGASLAFLLFLADNITNFHYLVQDEPLFIVHHIDVVVSGPATNLLQEFRDKLGKEATPVSALDEDDNEDVLVSKLPEDTRPLQECLTRAQGCVLLLLVKHHLTHVYNLSEMKIEEYTPDDANNVHKRPVSARKNVLFSPKSTLKALKINDGSEESVVMGRTDLIRRYLSFKQLMLKEAPKEPNNRKVSAVGSSACKDTRPKGGRKGKIVKRKQRNK